MFKCLKCGGTEYSKFWSTRHCVFCGWAEEEDDKELRCSLEEAGFEIIDNEMMCVCRLAEDVKEFCDDCPIEGTYYCADQCKLAKYCKVRKDGR